MKIKYKLPGIVSLVVLMSVINMLVVLSVLVLTKDDALLVNIAGRQRMLNQKMGKNVALLELSKTDLNENLDRDSILDELKKAEALYDQTITSFISGGDIIDGAGEVITISKIGERLPVLKENYQLWTEFKIKLDNVLTKGDHESSVYIYEHIDKLHKLSNQVVLSLQMKSDSKLNFLKLFQYLVVGLSLLIMVTVFLFLKKSIITPLSKMHDSMNKAMKGDLTVSMDLKSKDEMGQAASDYNNLLSSLTNLIFKVGESTVHAKNVSINLSEASEESSAALEEITVTVRNMQEKIVTLDNEVVKSTHEVESINEMVLEVAEQINHQNDHIANSSASIEQMDASIKSVAGTTESRMVVIESLNEKAVDGEREMTVTIDLINQIAGFTNTILDVLSVINNIASQTNLLAMNAAIEAAHAGEAGKGFAVVADEIRKLAEDTSNNASEISTTLKKVVENIEKSGDSSKKTGEYFNEIVTEAADVAQSMMEIKNSMNELSAGSTELISNLSTLKDSSAIVDGSTNKMVEMSDVIIGALRVVERISGETNSGMKEINQGIKEIFNSAVIVSESGVKNSESVEQIEKNLGEFKIV